MRNVSALNISPSIASFDLETVSGVVRRLDLLRLATVRIGYYATLLYRPNPDRADTAAEREEWLGILKECVAAFEEISGLLEHGTAMADVDPGISAWVYRTAKTYPQEVRMIARLNNLCKGVFAHALETGPEQNDRLVEHMKIARGGFYQAIARICDALDADLLEARTAGLQRTAASATALAQRLRRLAFIGKHVRIASLNASVEAARAGDAGRGLSIIAHEFKALAEEISEIAREAHDDVAEISSR